MKFNAFFCVFCEIEHCEKNKGIKKKFFLRCTEEKKNYRFLLCDTAVAVAASKGKSTAEKWEKKFFLLLVHRTQTRPSGLQWKKKLVIGSTLCKWKKEKQERKRHKACIKFLISLMKNYFCIPNYTFVFRLSREKELNSFFFLLSVSFFFVIFKISESLIFFCGASVYSKYTHRVYSFGVRERREKKIKDNKVEKISSQKSLSGNEFSVEYKIKKKTLWWNLFIAYSGLISLSNLGWIKFLMNNWKNFNEKICF